MSPTQPAPFPSSARRTGVTAFAAIAVVAVVALAVVGGGALLANRGSNNVPAAGAGATAPPAPTPPAAPSPTASSDEAFAADLAAVLSDPYDAAKVAALYAPNAVIHELTEANVTSTGLEEIGARIRYLNAQDFKAVVTSASIRQDNFVANFVRFGPGEATYPGLVVYELKDGKVLNEWVYPAP